MIVPAIVACFLSVPYREVAFVAEADDIAYLSAGKTLVLLLGERWVYVWPAVLSEATLALGAALVMSCIDRHFRTGRLSLRSPLSMINNSVFPIALGMIVMCAIEVLLRFVLFGLVSLTQFIGRTANFIAGATTAIVAGEAVGFFILHVAIVTPMLYWAPIMFIYGYGFRDAAAASFKLLAGKRAYRGILLPTLLCAGLQLLAGFLQFPYAADKVVAFILSFVTDVYVTVYVMISFYEISDLERRDRKPYDSYALRAALAAVSERSENAADEGGAREEKPTKAKAPKAKSEKQTKAKTPKTATGPIKEKPAEASAQSSAQSSAQKKSASHSASSERTKKSAPEKTNNGKRAPKRSDRPSTENKSGEDSANNTDSVTEEGGDGV